MAGVCWPDCQSASLGECVEKTQPKHAPVWILCLDSFLIGRIPEALQKSVPSFPSHSDNATNTEALREGRALKIKRKPVSKRTLSSQIKSARGSLG